jgi:hypothetical protein
MLQNARPPREYREEPPQPVKPLNDETKRLLEVFRQQQGFGGANVIHVNNVVSRMASFYEKIRNAIDYRDEHLLRKNAIERILKRLLTLGRRDRIAKHLIYELIQARYLPNDRIPESREGDVQRIIERYLLLIEKLPPGPKLTDRAKITRWFLSLASVEIEEVLWRFTARCSSPTSPF